MNDSYWETFPEVLSIGDLSRILRKTRPTIGRWLKDSKIPAHRIAGRWIIYRDPLRHEIETPHSGVVLPEALLARYTAENISAEDQADILGITKQTVYRHLASGKLPGHKVDGTWLIATYDFVQLLERTSNQLPQPPGDKRS